MVRDDDSTRTLAERSTPGRDARGAVCPHGWTGPAGPGRYCRACKNLTTSSPPATTTTTNETAPAAVAPPDASPFPARTGESLAGIGDEPTSTRSPTCCRRCPRSSTSG
jgi:hypothetical protein